MATAGAVSVPTRGSGTGLWLKDRRWDLTFISLSITLVASPYLLYLVLMQLPRLVTPLAAAAGTPPDPRRPQPQPRELARGAARRRASHVLDLCPHGVGRRLCQTAPRFPALIPAYPGHRRPAGGRQPVAAPDGFLLLGFAPRAATD